MSHLPDCSRRYNFLFTDQEAEAWGNRNLPTFSAFVGRRARIQTLVCQTPRSTSLLLPCSPVCGFLLLCLRAEPQPHPRGGGRGPALPYFGKLQLSAPPGWFCHSWGLHNFRHNRNYAESVQLSKHFQGLPREAGQSLVTLNPTASGSSDPRILQWKELGRPYSSQNSDLKKN